MKHVAMSLTIGAALVLGSAGTVFAASNTNTTAASRPSGNPPGNPSGTGQPSQECGSATAPNTPGGAASAPGSAFNPDGKAGTVYAGEQPQNSNNPKSVSQYDTACYNQQP